MEQVCERQEYELQDGPEGRENEGEEGEQLGGGVPEDEQEGGEDGSGVGHGE